MKRTSAMKKPGLKLKQRLELVRTTIRELSPTQLHRVDGGYGDDYAALTAWCPTRTCVGCGCLPYTYGD